MGNSISYTSKEHTLDLGPKGRVRGIQYEDKARRFSGLPYALPPTGQHRWRKPRPLPPSYSYSGPDGEPFDATTFRPPCPQDQGQMGRALVADLHVGLDRWSEDCLFVNVWTPVPATEDGEEKWPVMIWLHGGWFQIGNPCQEAAEDPTELISTAGLRAVVVAVGYRLNIFGFLATQALADESNGKAAGNIGLWDQRAAIEWVHENIGSFGGDAGNVTLAGRSAGAYSVEAQVLHDFRRRHAPVKDGLFHRIFMASNAIPAQPKTVSEAEPQFDQVCRYFHIPPSLAGGEKLARLRQLSQERLMEAVPRLQHHTFRPVTDDIFFHSGMLGHLRDGPFALEFKKRGLKVLIGEVLNEETLYAQYGGPEQGNLKSLLSQLSNYYAPRATERILSHYELPQSSDIAAWKALFGNVIADAQVRASTRCLVHCLHAHGVSVSDIWRYRIDYRLSFIGQDVAPMSFGVAHAMDGPLWNFAIAQGPTYAERELMDNWIRILVAFVQHDGGFDLGTRAIDDVRVATCRGTVETQKDARYAELRCLGEIFLGRERREVPT